MLVEPDRAEHQASQSPLLPRSARASQPNGELSQIGLNPGEGHGQSGWPRDQNHVESYSPEFAPQTIAGQPEPGSLPEAAPSSVSVDGATDLAACADPNPDPAASPARGRKTDQAVAGEEAPPRQQALEVSPGGEAIPFFHVVRMATPTGVAVFS